MTLLLSLACSNDFLIEPIVEPSGSPYDTAAPLADTEDTGVLEEEPEEEPEEEEAEEDDPAPEDDCEGTSDLVYVVSRSDESLYLFEPTSLSFTKLGVLDCGWTGSPNSMAVSRDGLAYVRYSDETVYEVGLDTLACTETTYNNGNFGSFGMGYATNDDQTWRDQLYIANAGALATLDTDTWKLSGVAPMPSQSELTGNADGELWAFLPLEKPAELIQVDKSSGSTLKRLQLPGFPDPADIDAFAFATWDKDFYVFVRVYGMGSSTDVYKVDPQGNMTKVLGHIGFDVVGAGVSTCAPA